MKNKYCDDRKLIIFDLDGVLVESRDMHYDALNMALEKIDAKFKISYDEHLARYDALPTTKKLDLLSKTKNLPENLHNEIWRLKQEMTHKIIMTDYDEDLRIQGILKKLKGEGHILYCASNAIFNTIKIILLKKGFMPYIDYFISCEDVKHSKPHPEIYSRCFARAGFSPSDCLIVEDSHIGRKAALDSGAHLCTVSTPKDLTYKLIQTHLNDMNKKYDKPIKWHDKITVVIPMAGLGSRFTQAGYTFPKPLIEIKQKPMIQVVFENLNIKPRNSKIKNGGGGKVNSFSYVRKNIMKNII